MIFNMFNLVLMSETETNTMIYIIVGVISGILVLVGLYFVLNFFYFNKKRCRKALKDLQIKYEYLHALLTGQDTQYIQRLEIISRTNLLYSDIHSSYFRRSKEIRDTVDSQVQEIISELQAYLEENKLSDFKQYFKSHINTIKQYEEAVNSLNNDLVQVIKPEEDCRQEALLLKEDYRLLKSKFNTHENDLQFVNDSFENVFSAIDERFNEFEDDVETANYDEAKALLPKIKQVMDLLDKLIDELPNICDEVNVNIPNRIEDLKARYSKMLIDRMPLSHLEVEAKLMDIDESLEKIRLLIKRLTVSNVPKDLNNINAELDNILNLFDVEEKAYQEFTSKNPSVIEKFSESEKEYIKITNNINRFTKVYVIDEAHTKLLQDISVQIDETSKDKRKLDLYMHNNNNIPYSVLLDKMIELDKGSTIMAEKINDFNNYLRSLKNDTQSAFVNLKVKYEQLKQAEFALRNFKIEGSEEKYKLQFDRCYELIDQINQISKTIPINVNDVNAYQTKLNEETNKIVTQIQELNNYKTLAENKILLANRDRMKFAEINNIVVQAETLYLSGDFKSAFEMSDAAIKKLNFRDGK